VRSNSHARGFALAFLAALNPKLSALDLVLTETRGRG